MKKTHTKTMINQEAI